MFQEWGFLLTEIWVLLALAGLVGLIAGWLIWGGAKAGSGLSLAEGDRLRADLDACRSQHAAKDARIAELERAATPAPVAAAAPVIEPAAAPAVDYDGDGVIEGTDEGVKPTALDGPRDGIADDLKRIKGIGPKLEKLCNSLGFWHFDQIAAWTDQEVAWVDANLEGFSGRVTRDKWVEQARLLASGAETEFSKRVDKGDVY